VVKEIRFSEHALLKMELLRKHSLQVDENLVKDVVINADRVEEGYKGRLIAQKGLDRDHVIRVVYEDKVNFILVITVYPGRRERYEKNQI